MAGLGAALTCLGAFAYVAKGIDRLMGPPGEDVRYTFAPPRWLRDHAGKTLLGGLLLVAVAAIYYAV